MGVEIKRKKNEREEERKKEGERERDRFIKSMTNPFGYTVHKKTKYGL